VKLLSSVFRAIDRGDLFINNEGEIAMRTLPCKICGKPYTDNITEKVDPAKGGYIICCNCAMKDPKERDKKPVEEGAPKWKKKNTSNNG
jgi:hypothetical protein